MTGDAPHVDSERWRHVDGADAADFVDYLQRAATVLRDVRLDTMRHLAVEPGCSVLDVGCGTGDFLIELNDQYQDIRATGIDVSHAMVDTARDRIPTGSLPRFQVGDVQQLDFPDGSFDRVNCERVLVHLRDVRTGFAEMFRVLAPGGRIAVSEPDFDALMIDSDDLAIATAIRNALASHLQNPDVGRRLRRYALQAGLVVDDLAIRAVPITSLEVANSQFHLFELLDQATTSTLVDPAAARAWKTQAEAADADRTLLVVPIMYRLTATKPIV